MDINELRKLVMKRQAAANKKISRLRTQKEVELAGTQYDPRRPAANIRRYNRRQLEAQLKRLDNFTSRKTNFERGMGGKPIPLDRFRQYKREEAKMNAHKYSRAAAVADVLLPSGETVLERRQKMPYKKPKGSNPAVNDPWEPKNRQPWQINGEAALKEMIKDAKRRQKDSWTRKQRSYQLTSATKMLDAVGDSDLANRVKRMHPDAFYLLFNHTSFVNDLSEEYEIITMTGALEADFNDVRVNAIESVRQHIEWAEAEQAKRMGSGLRNGNT